MKIETGAALGEHLDRISGFPVSAVSVESSGPDPHSDEITAIHIGNPSLKIEMTGSAISTGNLQAFFRGPAVKVFHDAKAGAKFILRKLGFLPVNVADTMLLEQVLDNDFERTVSKPELSSLSLRYLDTEPGVQPRGAAAIPVIYGVFLRQIERLKNVRLMETASLESRASTAFAAMENAGLPIDPVLWSETASACDSASSRPPDLIRYIHPSDGRIHSEFNQLAAPSGRSSSSNPNIQGIPKTAAYRRCIRPADGRLMITADYSACELRILAEASGDPVFIRTFSEGGDLHSIVAKAVFGRSVSKTENPELRQRAKIINFGLAYGMGPQGLAAQAGIPAADAETLLERYFSAFPRIRDYLEQSSEAAMRRGYAVTLGGRRCALPAAATLDKGRKAELKRFCKNMPIQGTNADMLKTAMPPILEELESAGINASIVNVVHDEILVEAPSGDAGKAAGIVRTAMIRAGAIYVKKVPVEVECSVGRYWGDNSGA